MSDNVTADEQYLLVEEVAEQLGLPLAVLLHRVEAGDIPARRIENENGVHYSLRLADLGIEPMREGESEGHRNGASASAFGGGGNGHGAAAVAEPAAADAGDGLGEVDLTGHRVSDDPVGHGGAVAPPPEPVDQREPAQPAPSMPPPWLHTTPIGAEEPQLEPDSETGDAELAVPPPTVARPAAGALLNPASTPHGDLAVMAIDARELVTGLLDRWERTLEQRIYTEQRQRFQGELSARQNMVKQLQMELHTARAEHAAAQADKDRSLAGKERELADRERQLADARKAADQAEQLVTSAAAAARRRRWFWQRPDD